MVFACFGYGYFYYNFMFLKKADDDVKCKRALVAAELGIKVVGQHISNCWPFQRCSQAAKHYKSIIVIILFCYFNLP